jgi:hypothetical protein
MRQTCDRWALVGLFAGVLGFVGFLCDSFAIPASPPIEAAAQDAHVTSVLHDVQLTDPVFPDKPASVHRVVQFRDSRGFPAGYSLHIQTEVCTDNKCKIVEATLYWDALGFYDRYECAPGKPLTKKEHVPFGEDDYAKLDDILNDADSILGQYSLAYLAKPVETDIEVDGLSGATPLTVQQSVVEDAAYTTWVMWRYAHGEIVPQLRRITDRSCTPEFLQHLFSSEDRRHVDFALKYVLQRSSDDRVVDNVFRVLETGDGEHVDLALRYLSRAVEDREQLHRQLIESCCRMNSMHCPKVLEFMSADPELSAATLELLTEPLDELPYFPIHLILRLLQERQFFTPQTEANISRLLTSDNFFVARRACEYLDKQELSPAVQHQVDAFRAQHQDRL